MFQLPAQALAKSNALHPGIPLFIVARKCNKLNKYDSLSNVGVEFPSR